jgi:hypothetical protein
MTVNLADLQLLPASDAPAFVPYATEVPGLRDYDYVNEEWLATGSANGNQYVTRLTVRRPRDTSRFSGVGIVEPLHVHGIAPIWMYTAPYILRSGHAWVEITAQKTTLDMHVKPSKPSRYDALRIEGPDSADFDPNPHFEDLLSAEVFWSELIRRNGAASAILAQVGAALRAGQGPFDGFDVRKLILSGHSQTGSVVSYYVHQAHDSQRLSDGTAVYDGFFPSGFPYEPFREIDVPIVQVLSEGDIALPHYSFRPGFGGRLYRRDDSDVPGDRYRLYELAGIPHMGTRNAPYNDASLWEATLGDSARQEGVVFGPLMNSLPHFELFSVSLHHLVQWVAADVTPPRAERLQVGPDGFFVRDDRGNTIGGVRCVQMDVPRARYNSNPLKPNGTPSVLTVGSEEPFDRDSLWVLYGDKARYQARFNERLDELIDEGWLLGEDAEEMRSEAERLQF